MSLVIAPRVLQAQFADQWLKPTGRVYLADTFDPLFLFLDDLKCVPTRDSMTSVEAYIALGGITNVSTLKISLLTVSELLSRFGQLPEEESIRPAADFFHEWVSLLRGFGPEFSASYVTALLKQRDSAWRWTAASLGHVPINSVESLLWLTLGYHEVGECETAERFQKLLLLVPRALFLGLTTNGAEAIFLSHPGT
ncbi:MAG: hypothetical protein JWM56_1135 [Candidatus Peribacteria bacterium]|nr:hypothetical protein [Candidatus Peribacteria bacterium]